MNKKILINEIFQKTNFQNYLEIGCYRGQTFKHIKAKRKFAVDPFFQIPILEKVKWIIKDSKNLNNKFFEEKSDSFFLQRKKYLKKLGQLDVVLVDGLHNFQASLNDVINSLEYLNTRGVIIMHDCYPPHKAAALPMNSYPNLDDMKDVEGWNGEWCGDVWKTIVYLRKIYPETLNVCVINADYGLGIIRPVSKIEKKDLIIDKKVFSEIDKMTYEELIQEEELMLNLKDSEYSKTIINEIAAHNTK